MSQRIRKGYCSVKITYDGGCDRTVFVHRLVCMAFLPNPENKPQVNHKDGNPANNHVSNLEWCTALENMAHARETGLCRRLRLSSSDSAKAIALYADMTPVRVISIKVGCSLHAVRMCLDDAGVYEKKRAYFKIDHASVVFDFKSGEITTMAMAKKHNCTSVAINAIARDSGCLAWVAYRDAYIRRICTDYSQIPEVAEKIGVSWQSIRKVCKSLPRPTTPESFYGITDLVKFKECVSKRMGVVELMAEFSCGEGAVATALKRTGLRVKKKVKHDYSVIAKLKAEGKTGVQISKQLGMRKGMVWKVLRRGA